MPRYPENEIHWVTIDGVHVPIHEGKGETEQSVANHLRRETARNSKSVDKAKFKDHAEEYVAGGAAIDSVFNQDELDYIQDNMEKTETSLYRLEDARFTAEKLSNEDIDPDDFKFNGTFRSFTRDPSFLERALDENSDDYAGIAHPVIFKVVGTKRHFNMDPYTEEYRKSFKDQKESLVGGRFEMVDNYMMKINNTFYDVIVIKQH